MLNRVVTNPLHAGSRGADYSERGSPMCRGGPETTPDTGSGLPSHTPLHLSTNLGSLQSPSSSAELLDNIQNLPDAAALFSQVLSRSQWSSNVSNGVTMSGDAAPARKSPGAVGALGRLLRRSCSSVDTRSHQISYLSCPPTPPPLDLDSEADGGDGASPSTGGHRLPRLHSSPPAAHAAALLLLAQQPGGAFAEEAEDDESKTESELIPSTSPSQQAAGAPQRVPPLPLFAQRAAVPRRRMPWELPPAGPSAAAVRQGGAPSVAETRARALLAGVPVSDCGGAMLA